MFDYEKLEKELGEACEEVNHRFLQRFNNDGYISVGGAKLDAFINELQKEFEETAETFIYKRGLQDNPEAKKRVLTITKLYAKNCIEQFGKVTGDES
ncbi:hypothetical protein [Flavobacterium sp.]|uniref:hypothetical protein n=1 Tax=Flavobacterium sp. TaxID=239 RepID=UPI0026204D93|nr:hypothetical protein [Flavobacterium sp.]